MKVALAHDHSQLQGLHFQSLLCGACGVFARYLKLGKHIRNATLMPLCKICMYNRKHATR